MIVFSDINLEEMKSLHDNSFPIPDIDNPLYICKKTVVEGGNIVAIGLVRLTCEAVLITNEKLPKTTRARAVTALKEAMSKEAKQYGLEDCHAFVKHGKVARFLRHLGFNVDKGGRPMVMQL